MSDNEIQKHFLIVDDDSEIRELLACFLIQHKYKVLTAENGEQMFALLKTQSFDLIILDVMMPGHDGFEVCRKLRLESNVPVIMLTAISEDADRIVGLELGADDYITKPFNPRELLARIKALLRRSEMANKEIRVSQQHPPKENLGLKFIDWTLDKATRRLLSPDGLEVALSAGEYDLLLAFVEHPQRVLSRNQLLDLTRDRPAEPFDRSIDVQISRLRHKIEEDPKKPLLIKTVRGGGYLFTAAVQRITS